ncbi:hypothetical protein HZS_7217 [Henneguya salminicola]|nr:hypothetical protein HZS_7217 [Henneguya salminicola]
MLRSVLYNSKDEQSSGFYKSNLISSSMIDYHIAFFPLEISHVKQCISAQAREINISDIDICVKNIIERIEFVPSKSRYFSATGCKKIFIFVIAFCT